MAEKYSTQSLDRAFQLIELLSMYPNGLPLGIIVQETGLNKSTCYRLLASLVTAGYITKDAQMNNYHLSFKMFEIGSRALKGRTNLSYVQPVLRKLTAEINQVSHFAILEGNSVLYIHKEYPASVMVQMSSVTGYRGYLHSTGLGRVMMAFMPEADREALLESINYVAVTPKTIVDMAVLREEILKVKSRGYAIDDEENELGVRCIACPICDKDEKAFGAISVSAPISYFNDEEIEKYAPTILNAAKELSAKLNASNPNL